MSDQPFWNKRKTITTAGLTLGCIGLYFGLRALPVEPCDFLHYGDFVNADGIIEGCGYEETGFFDLNQLRFPILAEIMPLGEAEVGVSGLYKLTLQTTSGRVISYRDVAVSHTERVHLMLVDPSLEDYHHLHPTDGGAPGTYLFEFTPKRAGRYTAFLDFIPLQNSRRTLLKTQFEVPGAPTEPKAEAYSLSYEDEAFRYRIVPLPGETFVAGKETHFSLEVESLNGEELVFSPVMDSYAHIVAFEPGHRGFAHFHPLNAFIDTQDPMNPELDFVFSVETPGYYRVWAQFAVNGKERFIPFDLQVREAEVLPRRGSLLGRR